MQKNMNTLRSTLGLESALDVSVEDEFAAEFAVQKKLNTRIHQWNLQWNSSWRTGSLWNTAAYRVEYAVMEWYLFELSTQSSNSADRRNISLNGICRCLEFLSLLPKLRETADQLANLNQAVLEQNTARN